MIFFAYIILLQKLPGIGGGAAGPGLTDYLNWIFRFMLVAAAFLAVVQIVIAGIQMIIGGASETQRSNAKSRIQDAIYGLLLALASWLILWTINPDLAGMKLTIPEVKIEVQSQGLERRCSPGLCPSGTQCFSDATQSNGYRCVPLTTPPGEGILCGSVRCKPGQECVVNIIEHTTSCQ